MQYRIGLGYDIHRLTKKRKLFLGGVEIAYEKGLLGHSDGDVVLHAICDALLGAIGERDLGELFPDRDPKYKGISSSLILKEVFDLVKEKDYEINNIDIVIVAKFPHLEPFKTKISENISKMLKISRDLVNVKAKTNQKIGEVGKGKAISSFTVCLLKKR